MYSDQNTYHVQGSENFTCTVIGTLYNVQCTVINTLYSLQYNLQCTVLTVEHTIMYIVKQGYRGFISSTVHK